MALVMVKVLRWGPLYQQLYFLRKSNPLTITETTDPENLTVRGYTPSGHPEYTTGQGRVDTATMEFVWYEEHTRLLGRGWFTQIPEVPLSGLEPESSV